MLAMRLVAVSGTRPLRCGMSAPRDWPCAEAGEPGWVGTTFSSQSTTSWGGGVRPATVGSARFGKTQRFREAGQDPVEGPERRRVLRRDQLRCLGRALPGQAQPVDPNSPSRPRWSSELQGVSWSPPSVRGLNHPARNQVASHDSRLVLGAPCARALPDRGSGTFSTAARRQGSTF
jgi:hypothetical protein